MVRPEGNVSLKNPVTPPGIDPGTVRLVAQHLNHYATPGPLNTERPKTNFMGVLFSDNVKCNNCIESVIDEWASMDHWWNNTDKRKPCSRAALYTTNLIKSKYSVRTAQ